jgi:YceI-like protein
MPAGPAYQLDPRRSEVRILVYRAGPLARLGHNHVLVSRDLSGELRLAARDSLGGAGFDIALPAAGLVVDEPAARVAEGPEFASRPTAADVEGTRSTLLGAQVLDAATFPTIRARGTTELLSTGLAARATFEVRGRATDLSVPLAVRAEGDTLTVSGGFGISQAALGLVPFSRALGALSVRDELEVRFRIVAVSTH